MKKIYSDDELFCNNEQKAYSGDAGCVDFLLGGIGTGNVSLGARGNLTTWQIYFFLYMDETGWRRSRFQSAGK